LFCDVVAAALSTQQKARSSMGIRQMICARGFLPGIFINFSDPFFYIYKP